MVPLPPLRDGGCALPICPFGRACLPLISDAPDCTCSPGRLRFLGDGHERTVPLRRGNFNPRAPCGARRIAATRLGMVSNFNPRAPCGARRRKHQGRRDLLSFQSTRPVRGATGLIYEGIYYDIFQSTRPVRGATEHVLGGVAVAHISIHAPRAGRDLSSGCTYPLS